MPRGFLVKRSKRSNPMSYRFRTEDEEDDLQSSSSPVHKRVRTLKPHCWPAAPERTTKGVQFGDPEVMYRCLSSPTRPVSKEQDFTLGSLTRSESFPATAAALTAQDHLFEPVDLKMNNRTESSTTMGTKRTKGKATPTKRSKSMRKLHLDDDVTTSPVLGLRIKEVLVDRKPPEGDGEFVCQLCGEAYRDPLSLAQHRCSRIVRVEYRCPECAKVFSCPANLASHRRWHKPKLTKMLLPTSAGRETSSPEPLESGSDDEQLECDQCDKKFKGHSHLRKHLASAHMHYVHYVPLKLSNAAAMETSNERHFRLLHSIQSPAHTPNVTIT
ncbi:insulinoma-associated protein 1a-like [Entelurus aequoreus]|uniref:insulinoma-associated protein 1a-like n=1 Tax=Entelurus aequoreus TaxID=161455 RepID=UPI002B1DC727|nr:insulinoma-associated protein 1a-like [Entelurus aequoreus]